MSVLDDLMITSGDTFSTTAAIVNDAGARIEAGSEAMVLAVAREPEPAIYLCQTLENDQFEVEEFYCFADQMRFEREVA